MSVSKFNTFFFFHSYAYLASLTSNFFVGYIKNKMLKHLLSPFLQLALAYNDSLLSGKLTASRGGIIQSVFIGSLRRRVEDLLNYSPGLKDDFYSYLSSGKWPNEKSQGGKESILLSCYLQWFSVPAPFIVKTALEKIRPKRSSSIPLLRLLLPRTHINAIGEIDKFFLCSQA